MATRHLVFVRHGQYVQDPESSEFGSLTRLGRRQASRSGQMLASERMLAVYSSDMPRAVESREIISRRLGYTGKQRRQPSAPRRDASIG